MRVDTTRRDVVRVTAVLSYEELVLAVARRVAGEAGVGFEQLAVHARLEVTGTRDARLEAEVPAQELTLDEPDFVDVVVAEVREFLESCRDRPTTAELLEGAADCLLLALTRECGVPAVTVAGLAARRVSPQSLRGGVELAASLRKLVELGRHVSEGTRNQVLEMVARQLEARDRAT